MPFVKHSKCLLKHMLFIICWNFLRCALPIPSESLLSFRSKLHRKLPGCCCWIHIEEYFLTTIVLSGLITVFLRVWEKNRPPCFTRFINTHPNNIYTLDASSSLFFHILLMFNRITLATIRMTPFANGLRSHCAAAHAQMERNACTRL